MRQQPDEYWGSGIAGIFGQLWLGSQNRRDDVLSGTVYQITHDKAMGRVAHVRLFGGSIQNRDLVSFYTPGSDEIQQGKVSQIRRYSGSRASDIGKVSRGQVAALCGLSNIKRGDILGEAQSIFVAI